MRIDAGISHQFEWMSLHYVHIGESQADPLRLLQGAFCCCCPMCRGRAGYKAISMCDVGEQYRLGTAKGEELRKLHRLAAPEGYDLYVRRVVKYRGKTAECERLGLDFYNRPMIEAYIVEYIHLLKTSPVCFQHDDLHTQNMIVTDQGDLSIIDFDSYDWGDPWEEYFKLP